MASPPEPDTESDWEVGDVIAEFGEFTVVYAGSTPQGATRYAILGLSPGDRKAAEVKSRPYAFLSRIEVKGGPGSGNHAHRGRPGQVGGSQPNPFAQTGIQSTRDVKVPQRVADRIDSVVQEVINEPNKLTRRLIASRKLSIVSPDWGGAYEEWNDSSKNSLIEAAAERMFNANSREYARPIDHVQAMPVSDTLLEALYLDRRLSQAATPRDGVDVFRGLRPAGWNASQPSRENWMKVKGFINNANDNDEFLFHSNLLESWSENRNVSNIFARHSPGSSPNDVGIVLKRRVTPDDVFLSHRAVPVGQGWDLDGEDNEREVVVVNKSPWMPVKRRDIISFGDYERDRRDRRDTALDTLYNVYPELKEP